MENLFRRKKKRTDSPKIDPKLLDAELDAFRQTRELISQNIKDAGKRDLPFDEGLPTPQAIRGRSAAESAEILAGAEVTALNDQHGFLRFPAEKSASLPVGTVLRLGLSHPCTAFDKWRLIPLIDDHTAADPRVVDLISTYF